MTGCLSRSLTGLQISPAAGATTVAQGQTAQFTAQGVYTESGHATTSTDVSSLVTWQSSNTAVATISSTGVAMGISPGLATITGSMKGSFGTVSATSNITVSAGGSASSRILTSLAITPASQALATAGQTTQLLAIGTYSSGSPSTQVLTNQATWQSSNLKVAQVDAGGLVTATGAGQATITALVTAADGSVISGTASITVASGVPTRLLTSVIVIPAAQTVLGTNETAQFLAVGSYSGAGPATQDLTDSVSWISSDAGVAQVNATGLATGIGLGQATITAIATATDGSLISGSATLVDSAGTSPLSLPTLTIYKAGTGSGTVTGNGVIQCGTGSGCTGTFASGTTVTLVAAPAAGSQFDGWSANCTPVAGTPTSCTLTLTGNSVVSGIFDLVSH